MPSSVIVRRSKRKSISIKIENQQVIVYAPLYASQKQISDVLLAHQDWINKRLSNPRINVNYDLSQDEYVYFLGNKYALIVETGKKNNIVFYDDMLLLQGKSIESINRNFRSFLIEQIEKRVEVIKKRLQIDFDTSYRFYKGKWGCCYKNKNLIVLNYLLACVDEACIDSVIYHEIAHFKVGNHQKAFYDYLERLFPGYKAINNGLKRYTIN